MASFLLASCSASKSIDPVNEYFEGKIPTTKVDNIDSFVWIENEEQLNYIARYDSAPIFIAREGCQWCEQQLTELKAYIKKTEILFYVVDVEVYRTCLNAEYNSSGDYALLYPKIQGTPTYLFYYGGKLINSHSGAFSENTLETAITNKYLCETNIYSLNTYTLFTNDNSASPYRYCYTQDVSEEENTQGFDTTSLDGKISGGDCTIIFSWRRCSDCVQYKNSVLYPFLIDRPNAKIYQYEVDGYYLLKRSGDEEKAKSGLKLWSDFSVKYHLTDLSGYFDIYGNPAGAVPTIVSFKNDLSHKTAVFRNNMKPFRNNQGQLQYSIAFYDEVKALTSDTLVSADDTTSSTYQRALKELSEKALKIELKKNSDFLKDNLE